MLNSKALNQAPLNSPASTADATELLFETAVIRDDAPEVVIAATVTETAVITDSATPQEITIGRVSAVITSNAVASKNNINEVTESFRARDRIEAETFVRTDVVESFVATDNTETALGVTEVFEKLEANSIATPRVIRTNDIVESASAGSYIQSGSIADLKDEFVASDSVDSNTRNLVTVTDSAVLDDNALGTGVIIYISTERFVASSAVSPTLIIIEDVLARAYPSDYVWPVSSMSPLPGEEDVFTTTNNIWTADMSTFGLSRYVDLGVNFIGSELACGEAGVFQRSDDGADAQIKTGESRMDSRNLKRVDALYLYGESDEPLEVTVRADHRGTRSEYAYRALTRDSLDSRAMRVDVGKGFRSMYYQLIVKSTGKMDIEAVVPRSKQTARRI